MTLEFCKETLSYKSEGAFYGTSAWDGSIYFLNKKNQFPTGLIHKLANALKAKRISFGLVDCRKRPAKQFNFGLKKFKEERPHQGAIRPLLKQKQRGVFLAGTGAGKSYMQAVVADELGVPTLIVTPDTGLRSQLTNDFHEFFDEKLVGNKLSDNKPIIIANIQSIAKADKKLFERFQLLLIDEFHHCYVSETKILTSRKSHISIKEVYEKFHSNKSVRVRSWNGTCWEDKKVINAFKYPAPKKMLKVKVQDEDGKIKEFVVTKNHKFLTDDGKIEIGKMKVGDKLVLGYKPHCEAMRTRSQNKDYRKYLSEKIKIFNANRTSESLGRQAETIKQKIKNGSYNPYGRGRLGNGGELSETQKEVLKLLKATPELSVALKDGQRPYHYKIDVAIEPYKIGIEIDGSSHKFRKQADDRKDARLGALEWKIVRIPENSSKEELLKLKKLIHQMILSMT